MPHPSRNRRHTNNRVSPEAERKARREARLNRWRNQFDPSSIAPRQDLPDIADSFFNIKPNYAFGGLVKDAVFTALPGRDLKSVAELRDTVHQKLTQYLREFSSKHSCKWDLSMTAIWTRSTAAVSDQPDSREMKIRTNAVVLSAVDDTGTMLDFAFDMLQNLVDNYNRNGSGGVITRIEGLEIHISMYTAIRTGRAGSYIELPEWIKSTQSCVNVKNEDDMCFKWAMEAAFANVVRNPQRVSNYISKNTFRFSEDMTFPFSCHKDNLRKFETLNKHLHLSINVYYANKSCFRSDQIQVLYTTNVDWTPENREVDLMLYENSEGEKHYVWIKNLSRLFGLNAHHKLQVCRRCLLRLPNGTDKEKTNVAQHLKQCKNVTECKVEYPPIKDAYTGFKGYHKKLYKPFVIYADFECMLVKTNNADNNGGYVSAHVPVSYSLKRVCTFDPKQTSEIEMYRATPADITVTSDGSIKSCIGDRFIRSLQSHRDQIMQVMEVYAVEGEKRLSTEEDDQEYAAATHCHICNLPFEGGWHRNWKSAQDAVKVWDHDHLIQTGRSNYRGAAHSWCNLQFNSKFKREKKNKKPSEVDEEVVVSEVEVKETLEELNIQAALVQNAWSFAIPVVFHNLRGYDGHIIMKAVDSMNVGKGTVRCIPQDGEKFLSFSFNNLKFIDSLQFLNSSLAKLVDIVRKEGNSQFKETRNDFGNICKRFGVEPTESRFELLLRKGEFPYEYVDSLDRLAETDLPPATAFHSDLTDSDITVEDYAHAKNVWNSFGIKDLGQYMDLYLLTDVLLLTDVFQRFRKICLEGTHLEPLHYVSLPGFSIDACYLHSEPIHEPATITGVPARIYPFSVEVFNKDAQHKDMYLFCEKAVRGGISMIPGRYSKANHKGLEEYDPTQASKFIYYFDANNLYGWAMSQPMPVGNYSWIHEPHTVTAEWIDTLQDDDPVGWIFEVDLIVPEEKHDYFKDYPPAPEGRPVREDEVSPYTKSLRDRTGHKHDETPKLLCTLENKVRYTVHYRNLKLYLRLGYKLVQCHRGIRFRQHPWLRSYIDGNTKKRAATTNEFEKDYYKLLNNSAFGKFLQDNRKHQDAKICTNPWMLQKSVSDCFFDKRRIINEDLVIAYMKKRKLVLNNPILVGVCILELSKTLMYGFYYNTMKRIFEDRVRLLFTDTDSLCMEIQTEDFNQEIIRGNAVREFDFSNYPKDHPLFNASTKAKVGLMKDEFGGRWIKEFVGLRSKMYSVLVDSKTMTGEIVDEYEKKTAKGVKRHVVAHQIRHREYKELIFNDQQYQVSDYVATAQGFKTRNNEIFTHSLTKTTLAPADDKLWLIDAQNTLPYSHYKIRQIEERMRKGEEEKRSES